MHGWTEPARLSVAPAGAGEWTVDGDDAWFAPRFPFIDGRTYAVLVDGTPAAEIARPGIEVRAVAIHPDVDEVPLNLLRVYVEFAAPVPEGHPIAKPDAFLDLELWDRERRRLTLLLDPGRIKRGLAGHEEAGYPLVEGGTFTLEIAGASRIWRVGPAVRARVDPAAWTIDGGIIRFDRPLDAILVARAFSLPGLATPLSWTGPPDEHVVHVYAGLEDLAGNSLRRVFDRELDNPEHDPLDLEFAEVRF